MAKDPAFNFYTNDFDQKTKFFTHEQVGMYLRLLMAQHQHGHLTEAQMIFICGRLDKEVFSKFITDDEGKFFNERLEIEIKKRKSYTESRRQSRLKSDEDNVRLYIVRDNIRYTYKIGSSVNPIRRYNELSNQKNPAIMNDVQGKRDLTLIWYSDVVLRSEETALHKQFSDKNIKGEWFSLSDEDLKIIFQKYKGTYVERTFIRTENEYEIENDNELKNQKECVSNSDPVVNVPREADEEIVDQTLKTSLDEIYLDQQRMKWPHIDFDFEYRTFCEKVRGSPNHYRNHDTGGMRLAFQSQLRNAKRKTHAKSNSKNDRTEFIANEMAIILAHASGAGKT
jgi:hypothetical protein